MLVHWGCVKLDSLQRVPWDFVGLGKSLLELAHAQNLGVKTEGRYSRIRRVSLSLHGSGVELIQPSNSEDASLEIQATGYVVSV